MTVSVNGYIQHLVSYYSINEVTNGALKPPSIFTELASLPNSPKSPHPDNFGFLDFGMICGARYRLVNSAFHAYAMGRFQVVLLGRGKGLVGPIPGNADSKKASNGTATGPQSLHSNS